ncbi:LacI family transcriptional regulator [Bordetella sputigena]|uniref:tripartite tricarboxylate transporter substrate binding protein n=1 Tax=Bordetella sputigena TaxID=1416810 RepID=UPI0039EFBFC0
MKVRRLIAWLCLAACSSVANAYPERPIRIVLGFPAGGGADVVLRTVTPGLAEELGQPVIVDNRPGAGGNLGMDMVAKSPPDGYTLLMAAPGLATNASLYENLPFDPAKDFTAVGMVSSVPNVLVVNPALPVHTVAQLIDYAKEHPGELNYASSGIGTSLHLAGALFERDAGVKLTHVPYRGGPAATNDLISGQVQLMFNVLPLAVPQVKAGKLRALAVTGPTRSPALPDVPTMMEAGVKGYTAITWNGIVAPAGTPAPIVNRLNAALQKVLDRPDVQKTFAGMGQDVVKDTPQEFDAMLKAETAKWRQVIEAAGIKAE